MNIKNSALSGKVVQVIIRLFLLHTQYCYAIGLQLTILFVDLSLSVL